MLTVENTGEKLTPQLVSTLTEPFQRGTERIRGDHAGVGLGLAIVKSIAQAHDGHPHPRPAGSRRRWAPRQVHYRQRAAGSRRLTGERTRHRSMGKSK